MFRVALIAVCAYMYGDESFDGKRPDMLDQPLRSVHLEVNQQMRDGKVALGALVDMWQLAVVDVYIEEVEPFTGQGR